MFYTCSLVLWHVVSLEYLRLICKPLLILLMNALDSKSLYILLSFFVPMLVCEYDKSLKICSRGGIDWPWTPSCWTGLRLECADRSFLHLILGYLQVAVSSAVIVWVWSSFGRRAMTKVYAIYSSFSLCRACFSIWPRYAVSKFCLSKSLCSFCSSFVRRQHCISFIQQKK